jgi:medium-chain acyl-[acyl-carrier-protein] hydrolase
MDMMVDRSTRHSAESWVEHLSPKRAFPLLCFPYAGGSGEMFRQWNRHFSREIDVCLVHLPGRGRRIAQAPFTNLKPLVETIADVVANQVPQPFAFYGHSMGALISFELARELRRRGATVPQHLFLSGRQAPTAPPLEGRIFDLPHDEFIAAVKKLNGTPHGVLDDPELRDLFLPLLRADFEIVDTYVHQSEEPLSWPITVYGGLRDNHVSVENLRDWQKQTVATCKTKMFPGDHFFIQDPASNFLNVLRSDVLTALNHLTTSTT